MGSMSIVHWAAVLLVVVLVFGTRKLGSIGTDLGKAVKGFKEGIKDERATSAAPATDIVASTQAVDQIAVRQSAPD